MTQMTSSQVLEYTSLSDIPSMIKKLRENFCKSNKLETAAARKKQLQQLVKLLVENESKLVAALKEDFKSDTDALLELKVIAKEIRFVLNHFEGWMKSEYVETSWINKMDSCYIQSEPYGLVLIIGAWNYPLSVVLEPLAGAIAAGNYIVIKPSEISSNTSRLLGNLILQYLDNEVVQVIQGGAHETNLLLEEKFDFICYTGGTNVGKIVYEKASKQLTPVLLEMGGKNPVIITDDANLEVTVRRLLYGKCMNGGQVCLAPDYVLCSDTVASALKPIIDKTLNEFFPNGCKASSDFSRIVNMNHTNRLVKLIEENQSNVIVKTDEFSVNEKFVPLVVFDKVSFDSSLMKEEIFGPLLPIVRMNHIDDMIRFVKSKEKPLVLYMFSNDTTLVEKVLGQCSSGSVCVNDTLMQATITSLPFGGIGASGIGKYRGKKSFESFSHGKSVMWRSASLDKPNKWIRYPPMNPSKWKWLSRMTGL